MKRDTVDTVVVVHHTQSSRWTMLRRITDCTTLVRDCTTLVRVLVQTAPCSDASLTAPHSYVTAPPSYVTAPHSYACSYKLIDRYQSDFNTLGEALNQVSKHTIA